MECKIAGWVANCVDADQMLCSSAADVGLHCSPRTICPNTLSTVICSKRIPSEIILDSQLPSISYKNICVPSQDWSAWVEAVRLKLFGYPENALLGLISAWMCRLIWVFSGRICKLAGNAPAHFIVSSNWKGSNVHWWWFGVLVSFNIILYGHIKMMEGS